MVNHAELSRDLALALGYAPEDAHLDPDGDCWVWREPAFGPHGWKLFDYRDPSVAMPLLKWLHKEHDSTSWWGLTGNYVVDVNDEWIDADTLEEAIARAVIAVGGK